MKTTEGNKLIAEFMGLKPQNSNDDRYFDTPDRYYKYDVGEYRISNTCSPENMQYHKSWDWLMPVVEKIEQTKMASITIHAKNLAHISFNYRTDIFFNGSLIENTYDAVIEFIKWYNKNK